VNESVVERMSWDEVAGRIERGAVAILPIGAGAKEHGFHLPMNTDRIQAEWLAARIAERLDGLIWPTVSYGYYPAFVAYAGSASLSAKTFEAVIGEIATAILNFGCRALLVLDTGISTRAPIDRVLADIGTDRVRHIQIHEGPRYREAALKLAEQSHGSHADELETSVMLALAPEFVQMARAEASPPRAQEAPGPLTPSDSSSPNYSRSGSYGDPTLATQEKGRVLLAAMVEDVLEQAASFPGQAGRSAKRGGTSA